MFYKPFTEAELNDTAYMETVRASGNSYYVKRNNEASRRLNKNRMMKKMYERVKKNASIKYKDSFDSVFDMAFFSCFGFNQKEIDIVKIYTYSDMLSMTRKLLSYMSDFENFRKDMMEYIIYDINMTLHNLCFPKNYCLLKTDAVKPIRLTGLFSQIKEQDFITLPNL